MANLRRHGSGPYHIEFRFQGQKFQRSLRTNSKRDAKRIASVVEQTADYVSLGVLSLPPNATSDDTWRFLVSGGKLLPTEKREAEANATLEQASVEYLDSYPTGSKEENTIRTERTHLAHLERILGDKKTIRSVTALDIQSYVKKRQKEPGLRGNKVSATTISKELATFDLLWKYGVSRSWCENASPTKLVPKPRASQKLPFMTVEEIERRVSRGGLSEAEIAEHWDALFLRENEIGEVLADLRVASTSLPHARYIYPAIAFCAYTGARRSEMFRALIDDVNGRVLIREKKRSQEHQITFREVPLHSELESILSKWLDQHPGGQHLFCRRAGKAIEGKTSQDGLKAALRKSEWKQIRGYHVFRHSFATNLARHGTDQRIIDSWMGHQTEEMRQRYRHLFPEDAKAAISVLSFAG